MPPTIRTTLKPFALTLVTAAAGLGLLAAAPVPVARAQNSDDLLEAAKKQIDKFQKKVKNQEEQEKQISASLAKQGDVLARAEKMMAAQADATKRTEAANARQEELINRQNRLIEQQQRQLEQAQRLLDGIRARMGGGPAGGPAEAPPVPPPAPGMQGGPGAPAPLIPPTPPASPIPPRGPAPSATPPGPLPTPAASETPKSPL